MAIEAVHSSCAKLRSFARMELSLKPTSAKVKDYYNALNQFGQLNISHETAVRQAFASLLDSLCTPFDWKLVQEFRMPSPKTSLHCRWRAPGLLHPQHGYLGGQGP